MYERSAIVLERYFDNLFGFNQPNNLLQNYKNYCELFEKFNSFQTASSEEFTALEEFQAAENAIEDIQSQEEKLYKKNAKYEYNRDLVFNDISQKPDEIEKCMLKLEADIAKTQGSLVTLREKFVEAIKNYNDKKSALSKAKKNRKNAEAEYNEIFEITRQNIENISEEYISTAKSFSLDENQEELINIMLENGKDEKIPFNNSVIRNAVRISSDIQKRFVESYVEVHNKTNKLLNELLEGAVSVELHQKTIRNINVKLNFLNAEKDYLIQFLDYERIMVIHGKRTHRNLMLDACENFNIDIVQIDNLYELLLKEISNKSTKKAYKELYNKSYLVDIEENDEKFKKEKNKINLSTATVMNTNYWRIEGIKNIYTVFYNDVVGVFGKDLDEFDVPKNAEEIENISEEANVIEEINIAETHKKEEIKETVEKILKEDVTEVAEKIVEIEEKKEKENIQKATKEKSSKKKTTPKEVQSIEEIEPELKKQEGNVDWDAILDVFDEIEMDVPKDVQVNETSNNIEKSVAEEKIDMPIIEEIESEEPIKKKSKKVKRYTRKKVVQEQVLVAEIEEKQEEPDIFGERFRDIEKQIAELDDLEECIEEKISNIPETEMLAENIAEQEKVQVDENMPYEDEDIAFEEESIFKNIENEDYEELNLKKIEENIVKSKKKSGIFKNIMKLNSKDKKKVAAK